MTILKIQKDGYRFWLNSKGRLHREDGPACECIDGHKEWYINGKLHRLDGPAVERSDGYRGWWITGGRYSEESYKEKVIQK